MTNEEAKNIVEQHLSELLSNPLVKLDEKYVKAERMAINALEQEQYYKDLAQSYEKTIRKLTKAISEQKKKTDGDCISRDELKKRLQEHHDFFVNAYGGFQNLPPDDKSRVDEITNCIAEVVNMPPVQPKPKTGRWIYGTDEDTGEKDLYAWTCSECGEKHPWQPNYCPYCGAKMEVEGCD